VIHPLIVHLPIGILLLAVGFEWIVRKERNTFLGAAMPLIWRIGAAMAVLSCLSGWWMRQSGTYTGPVIDYHQWAGIATAVVSLAVSFFQYRFWWGIFTAVLVGITGHFGGTLTHGEGYLWGTATAEAATVEPVERHTDLPDTVVAPAAVAAIQRLQKAGLTVIPVAQGSPWLTISFVNQYTPADSLFELLETVAPQVTRLRLNDVKIPEQSWEKLGHLPHLSRIYLYGSNVKDVDLQHLTGLKYLKYINLSHTEITAGATPYLEKMPGLQQVYLYKTNIQPGDWPGILATLSRVQVDTGNYHVATLATDTTMLTTENKY
jgi:uncharacterized membrane protein